MLNRSIFAVSSGMREATESSSAPIRCSCFAVGRVWLRLKFSIHRSIRREASARTPSSGSVRASSRKTGASHFGASRTREAAFLRACGSESDRTRRLTISKSTRFALVERMSTAAERTDEASSASAAIADEMARSASSLASARRAERRIRGLFPLRKGASRSASARVPVSPTPSMAAASCREAANQALDVDVPRNKRELVRAGDESGEAANAGRSVEQHVWEHSGNTLRHVLREDGKNQSSNGGNGIVMQEPFENGSPMLEVYVGGNGSDGARADNGIRIAQGSVDETAADFSSTAGEQLVHHPADRCGEPRFHAQERPPHHPKARRP